MAFTTQTFTFVFLPLCLAMYYLTVLLEKHGFLSAFFQKIRVTDLLLIGIGCVFYLWSCFDDLFRFLAYILVIWLLGKAIETKPQRSTLFLIGICFALFVLIHFKYTGMVFTVWNFFFKDSLSKDPIVAPLGISFITFSAISYLADIYHERAESGSFIDCALYLSFFPKVVSGPIVLWRDFERQPKAKNLSLTGFADGISLLMLGFTKKLILADSFGDSLSKMGTLIDTPTAWFGALLYMLQLYFDFSGYSDIAIGLSKMLGFSVKANFNFPYLSCSISEFWRRWHISLGTWFKEYVYIPLGGNRKGTVRTLVNVLVVFLLTGIWHGAGVTYLTWGGINGFCIVVEKLIADKKWYQKTPSILKWICTFFITLFCWELFRFESFSDCTTWILTMFGKPQPYEMPYTWKYFLDAQIITLAIIGVLGSTVCGLPKVQQTQQKLIQTKAGYITYQLVLLLLFVLSIVFMVNSQYSPFIYFRY